MNIVGIVILFFSVGMIAITGTVAESSDLHPFWPAGVVAGQDSNPQPFIDLTRPGFELLTFHTIYIFISF